MKKPSNKKLTKEYNKILSPTSKKINKNTLSHNFFKELEISKLPLSQKKSENELILSKKKKVYNNYHRRTKSNNQNNIENIDINHRINSSVYQLSFITENKEKANEKEEKQNLYNKSAISRNKRKILYRPNSNILSISFSLKDISNHLIDSCYSNKNFHCSKNNHSSFNKYYNNDTNIKYNKSVYFNDYSTNIEETRNTTTNTNINQLNNSILLLYNKHHNNERDKDKGKEKAKRNKFIKSNNKQKRKLYSSMDNNLKKNYLKANNNNDIIHEQEKSNQKYNLHRFIYNNSNINSKNNIKSNNYNHYLYSLKKSFFRNCEKTQNQKSPVYTMHESCIGEPLNNNKPEKDIKAINTSKTFQKKVKFMNKKNISSSVKNESKKICVSKNKNKKKNNKSQEKQNKMQIKEFGPIKEFESVEEIHFMFVKMNQRKRSYLNKYD